MKLLLNSSVDFGSDKIHLANSTEIVSSLSPASGVKRAQKNKIKLQASTPDFRAVNDAGGQPRPDFAV